MSVPTPPGHSTNVKSPTCTFITTLLHYFPDPRSAPEAMSSTGMSISVESWVWSGFQWYFHCYHNLYNPRGQLDVSPQKSNEIYKHHLWLKGCGFPLWIPEPNKWLLRVYQKKGINIGDIGIITPSGGFSFLFNICVPSDNPINPRLLPEEFAPISPPLDAFDVIEFDEFKPGSYLASSSIENSQSGSDAQLVVHDYFMFPRSLTWIT